MSFTFLDFEDLFSGKYALCPPVAIPISAIHRRTISSYTGCG